MSTTPNYPCRHRGCPQLVSGGGYCQTHAKDARSPDRRESAHRRGYGRRWKRLRDWMLSRRPFCAIPGCGRPATDLDHIVPRAEGGTDDPDNLQPLCKACHSRKTAAEDKGFGNA